MRTTGAKSVSYRVSQEGNGWTWELYNGGQVVAKGEAETEVKARARAISRAMEVSHQSLVVDQCNQGTTISRRDNKGFDWSWFASEMAERFQQKEQTRPPCPYCGQAMWLTALKPPPRGNFGMIYRCHKCNTEKTIVDQDHPADGLPERESTLNGSLKKRLRCS